MRAPLACPARRSHLPLDILSFHPAASTGKLRDLLLVAAWIALALNAPVWLRHLADSYGALPLHWQALAGASEAALVFCLTTVLLLACALAGRWAWKAGAGLMLLVSALCAYFMSQFNVLIGYGVVQAALTTDHDMSGELLSWQLFAWWAVLGWLPAWWLWRRPAPTSLRRRLLRRAPAQVWALLALTAAVLLSFDAGLRGLELVKPHLHHQGAEVTVDLGGITAYRYVPSNWITASAMVLTNTWAAGHRLKVAPQSRHRYVPSEALNGMDVVVVIGETARHDHWGMLGYGRNTTPQMQDLPGVAAFRARSCDTATKLSLRCMFVRPEGITPGDGLSGDTIGEEPVFSVLKHLGFDIELLGMQSEVTLYQNLHPDRYKIREMIFADPRWARLARDDELLVHELKASLARPATGPRLHILHLKGSHFLYTQRYPRAFARWQPECVSVAAGCGKEALINSYDNSILFTDHVLAQVAEQLKDRRALLVYTSDHGESIEENSHFHATPRALAPPEQLRVPLLLWPSPALRTDPALAPGFARLLERAARDADGQTGHFNLYASILGCLGIHSPDGGVRTQDNLCAP